MLIQPTSLGSQLTIQFNSADYTSSNPAYHCFMNDKINLDESRETHRITLKKLYAEDFEKAFETLETWLTRVF